jgi:hypothetical protein
MNLAVLLIAATHMSNQEAADKLTWSLLPTRESVLHACSLHAFTQDSLIYVHVSAQVSGQEARVHAGYWHTSEWAGNSRARWLLAHRK